jgi:tRNA threonylcarbamoyl adenosine modification protein (Sua5/YciO/YrdC/YwlC family)
VIVYDPYISKDVPEAIGASHTTDLNVIWSQADFITVHVPKTKDTVNLLNTETLKKCKAGVRIINCARGGIINEADLAEALRKLRGLDERHHLTVLCRDMTAISQFARVDNAQFRLLKQATPGPWTFILEASREVPRRVSHPSRKTIGIRVPGHPVTLAFLEMVDAPLLSMTLIPEGEELPLNDPEDIRTRFQHALAAVIDAGACPFEPTTVIDLTGPSPELIRRGRGDPAVLGIS